MGLADFWSRSGGLTDEHWKVFADPKYFGAAFEGIVPLHTPALRSVPRSGVGAGPHFAQGCSLRDRCGRDASTRRATAVYAER